MIKVGLYGANGHQIQAALVDNARAELVAVAAFPETSLPVKFRAAESVRRYTTLAELLADDRVDLVSLCSPRRADQAADALAAMAAGKHVYAEKPCAMNETDLDAIIAASARGPAHFHEMAGSAFDQPYLEMRRLILAGTIGTVVQLLVQKSYPYHDQRPQDENIDGGLTLQVGVHALRFVEHLTGLPVRDITALETTLGNPGDGGLRMAVAMNFRLENDAVGAVVCNYLNSRAFGSWGNEMVRIFGTKGWVEATDGGQRTRLVLNDKDHGPLNTTTPGNDYFNMFLKEITGEEAMPLSLEQELHPTRMVIRARATAQDGRRGE